MNAVTEPIIGEITASGEPARPFEGWLQLISELEAALESLRMRNRLQEEA